jgi:hypothetical protein
MVISMRGGEEERKGGVEEAYPKDAAWLETEQVR